MSEGKLFKSTKIWDLSRETLRFALVLVNSLTGPQEEVFCESGDVGPD